MDLPELPDLESCLRRHLAQVPPGRVTTCGDLAKALGHHAAALWIAQWSLDHRHDAGCPCHRIVRAGGAIGGYLAGETAAKARLLASEGVVIHGQTVDLLQFGFSDFVGPRPLDELQQMQQRLAAQVSLCPPQDRPRLVRGTTKSNAKGSGPCFRPSTDSDCRRLGPRSGPDPGLCGSPALLVGGLDVAYPTPTQATGAFALVDTTGKEVWSLTVTWAVTFPYISSFLSFRELPTLLELLGQIRAAGRMPDVFLVDGAGILHPRGAGVATHFGVLADWPTVGVTKKFLCGQVDLQGMAPGESRPVLIDGQPRGVALRGESGSQRPIFVSPGHRMSIAMAERVVRGMLFGRRLPAPIRLADRLSKRETAK